MIPPFLFLSRQPHVFSVSDAFVWRILEKKNWDSLGIQGFFCVLSVYPHNKCIVHSNPRFLWLMRLLYLVFFCCRTVVPTRYPPRRITLVESPWARSPPPPASAPAPHPHDVFVSNPPDTLLLLYYRPCPSFRPSDTNMVSTMMPPQGRRTISIPTRSGGGGVSNGSNGSTGEEAAARVLNGSQKQPPSSSSSTPPPRFSYGEPEDVQEVRTQHEQHPASPFYFFAPVVYSSEQEDRKERSPPSPEAQQILGDATPVQRDEISSRDPPEPGGGEGAGEGAFQSSYDRPWRKRARDSRRETVFENTEGLETGHGGGDGDGVVDMCAMRKRASEKEEVVASRKKSQQKAINRAAMPFVDLVGVVSPLVLIVGMSMAQNVP